MTQDEMRAKVDNILPPAADVLIVPERRENIGSEAFFKSTMFQEGTHGLEIKTTLDCSDPCAMR